MFKSKNKKNNVYPCKPQFYYIEVGCKVLFITQTGYHDGKFELSVTNEAKRTLILFDVSAEEIRE